VGQGAATGGTACNVRIRILLVATAAAMVAACGGGGGSPNETLAEPAAAAVTPVAAAATPPAASAAPPAAAAPAQASGLVASPADLANTSLPGNQYVRSAAALADGGYAVAWLDGTQLAAQRFDASGAKAGTETHVGASFAPDAAVTVLRDGSIVTASA